MDEALGRSAPWAQTGGRSPQSVAMTAWSLPSSLISHNTSPILATVITLAKVPTTKHSVWGPCCIRAGEHMLEPLEFAMAQIVDRVRANDALVPTTSYSRSCTRRLWCSRRPAQSSWFCWRSPRSCEGSIPTQGPQVCYNAVVTAWQNAALQALHCNPTDRANRRATGAQSTVESIAAHGAYTAATWCKAARRPEASGTIPSGNRKKRKKRQQRTFR